MSTNRFVVIFLSPSSHSQFMNQKEIKGVKIELQGELNLAQEGRSVSRRTHEKKITINSMFNYSPKSLLKYGFDQAI